MKENFWLKLSLFSESDSTPPATEDTSPATVPEGGREETFDQLIKGRYKEDYERAIKAHIDKRLKNSARAERENAALRTLMKRALPCPQSQSPEECAPTEKVDTAARAARSREAAHWVRDLRAQAEDVRKVFPNFDLDTEMRDPVFARLVRPGSGVTLEGALYAVHHKAILAGAVRGAAERSAARTADTVRANLARPAEGGLNVPSQTLLSSDPSKWSKRDRAEVRARVQRGEKIRF